MDMGKRLCKRCGEIKEYSAFVQRNGNPDGHICRKCKSQRQMELRRMRRGEDYQEYSHQEWIVLGKNDLLRGLGYDLEKNIHEQFIQRGRDKGWWV